MWKKVAAFPEETSLPRQDPLRYIPRRRAKALPRYTGAEMILSHVTDNMAKGSRIAPVLITVNLVTNPWIHQASRTTNFTPCCSNGLTAYTTRGSGCESNIVGVGAFLGIKSWSANYNSQIS
ncbi:hypothetical protein HBH98_154280 [Parastagonospora nodorum]|nr:hypothetical protein HBH52_244680 [Parastagonospora nodorum]KAH4216058.1 hypothetical protein HBI06_236620 [Parastagonospora nodorum]KAH4232527.1 hypothetical protein HBI05_173860 [Parastagonospora nodorum]KAH4293199.1 hypothetical protein HBI02_187580 [Parastagonospora nodorum]KAH4324067.1 hypothetical protein HBI00_176060 [Parastagonospora nodorum]